MDTDIFIKNPLSLYNTTVKSSNTNKHDKTKSYAQATLFPHVCYKQRLLATFVMLQTPKILNKKIGTFLKNKLFDQCFTNPQWHINSYLV